MLRAYITMPLLLGLQLVLVGCSGRWGVGEVAIATKTGIDVTKPATPSATAQPYGLDGQLSEQDTKVLTHLTWPQSYDAIKDRFGFPAYRDDAADYYKLPNGHWAAIFYTGAQATSYSLSDSQ